MVRFAFYLAPIFIILSLISALIPNKVYAQTACQSISGCTLQGPLTKIKEYNLDADSTPECVDNRQFYTCAGTTCFQDSTTCTEQIGVCNNGVGNTPNDGYTCETLCNSLAIPANCGNYPPPDLRPDCFTYKFTCGRYYCFPAGGTFPGGAPNYTCPSPQECISPPDPKAHQCITPVAPTVNLTANSPVFKSGEQLVLSWTTTNAISCKGFDFWAGTNPQVNNTSTPISYPPITQTNTGSTDIIKAYTIVCYNSQGTASTPSSVSVTVKPLTCPDYTTCSSCVSQNSCGWNGSTCQTGSPSCPANTTSWFWTDCLTNQCSPPTPTPTPTTTCSGFPTCSVSASAISSTSGTATISQTGGCSTGYDRVEWFLDNVSKGSNFGPSADFTGLTTGTTYNVSASWWSISDSTKPSVTCQPPASFTPTSTSTPPPSTTTSTSLDCLYCGFGTTSGVWVNQGEQSCNSGWNASGGICQDPGYKWACDNWGTTNNPQYIVTPDLNQSTNPPSRGTACKKTAATSSSTTSSTTSSPTGVVGAYLIRNPDATVSLAAKDIFPIWWWIYHSNLYGGHCILSGTINGGTMCYQPDWYNQTAGLHFAGNGDAPLGTVAAGTNLIFDYLQLYSWPDAYRPIGYYTYQEVYEVSGHENCTCYDTNGCSANGCVQCGGVTCRDASDCSCEHVTDTQACRSSLKSAFQPISGFVKNQINTVTSAGYCAPASSDSPRVDIVFEKLPNLSGLVCRDNNSDGNCISGTGTSRTCTDGPYTSGGITATPISPTTGQAISRQVTPGGGYSMYLPQGSYTVGFSQPNVVVTSPSANPRLLTISADTTQDYCVNPLSAWLKTTGGDVHSNSGINTPGGP